MVKVGAEVLTWISCLVLMTAANASDVGVNWGITMSKPIPPKTVVEMLQANNISKVKLFDSDSWTVSHLAGTGIETMLGIPDQQLKDFANYDKAQEWVKKNVTKYLNKGGVNIKYVVLGHDPVYNGFEDLFLNNTFTAIQNIQKALDEAGYGDQIKATISVNAGICESPTYKPSDGNFAKGIRALMVNIVRFLDSKKSPLQINMYPFLSLLEDPAFPLDFAFFDDGEHSIFDNGVEYTNYFDAEFDTMIWSLKKAGVPNMKVIVGQVGWPTDCNYYATVDLAHRFYSGFMKKLANKTGTPLRPGEMEVYLYSLFDENKKSTEIGNYERHWGIFRYDGYPKFPLDLAGEGRETYPIAGKVKYMASQWCVLDKSLSDVVIISTTLDYACRSTDCSSLSANSSCSKLDRYGKASYALNMYFQMHDQDPRTCDFDGKGKLTNFNISRKYCLFPLAIDIDNAGDKLKFVSVTSVLLFFIVMAIM